MFKVILYYTVSQGQLEQPCLQKKKKKDEEEEEGEEKEKEGGAGEMAQWLRALTGLPKVLSSIPSNHMVAHNHLQ
ncbi:hypothetical protein LEMLEM_LOCUS9914 [Lemmus lemmus]